MSEVRLPHPPDSLSRMPEGNVTLRVPLQNDIIQIGASLPMPRTRLEVVTDAVWMLGILSSFALNQARRSD